jgi:hypothetical protein
MSAPGCGGAIRYKELSADVWVTAVVIRRAVVSESRERL